MNNAEAREIVHSLKRIANSLDIVSRLMAIQMQNNDKVYFVSDKELMVDLKFAIDLIEDKKIYGVKE